MQAAQEVRRRAWVKRREPGAHKCTQQGWLATAQALKLREGDGVAGHRSLQVTAIPGRVDSRAEPGGRRRREEAAGDAVATGRGLPHEAQLWFRTAEELRVQTGGYLELGSGRSWCGAFREGLVENFSDGAGQPGLGDALLLENGAALAGKPARVGERKSVV